MLATYINDHYEYFTLVHPPIILDRIFPLILLCALSSSKYNCGPRFVRLYSLWILCYSEAHHCLSRVALRILKILLGISVPPSAVMRLHLLSSLIPNVQYGFNRFRVLKQLMAYHVAKTSSWIVLQLRMVEQYLNENLSCIVKCRVCIPSLLMWKYVFHRWETVYFTQQKLLPDRFRITSGTVRIIGAGEVHAPTCTDFCRMLWKNLT